MAMNYPIQASSADITKLACIYLFREISKRGMLGKILIPNIIHDEILLECPKEIAEEWAGILKECMERAGSLFCKTVPLKAEPEILEQWKK